VRDPQGNLTTFTQIGWASMAICGGVGAVVLLTAASILRLVPRAPLALLGPAIAVALALGALVMCATLTIEAGDDGVAWYFTGGILGKFIRYADIVSYRPVAFVPLSFGYRIGAGKTAWIVHGGRAVSFETAGRTFIVGTSDPEAVCAEIARRSGRESAPGQG